MPKAAPTDDLAEFRELSRPGRKHMCLIIKATEHLDEQNAALLLKALDDPDVGHVGIYQWLKKRGIIVHSDAIGRHRRGRCRCADE